MTNFERYFNSPNNTAEWLDKITDGCELDSSQCRICPIHSICRKKDFLAYLQKEEYPDTRKGGLEQARRIVNGEFDQMFVAKDGLMSGDVNTLRVSILNKIDKELNK